VRGHLPGVDVTPRVEDDRPLSHAQTIRDLVEQGVLADEVGVVSRTRGFAVPSEIAFRYEIGAEGALYVGSPENVGQKIARNLTMLGANRFDLKYGIIPRVRELLAAAGSPRSIAP
jgi:hypothetical protein